MSDLRSCYQIRMLFYFCAQIEYLICGSELDQDKWRNMSVSFSGLGSREKVRTPKSKLPLSPQRPSSGAGSSGQGNIPILSLPSTLQRSEVTDPAKKPKFVCPSLFLFLQNYHY